MTDDIDQATRDIIIATANDVRHIMAGQAEMKNDISTITTDVSGLKVEMAVCLAQKDDVETLKDDVGELKTGAANMKGKIAAVIAAITFATQMILAFLPGLFPGGR